MVHLRNSHQKEGREREPPLYHGLRRISRLTMSRWAVSGARIFLFDMS